ncbi:MAG: hypothetical protein J2P24_09810, partial [Streptosporangiales bacterium]|nr:hypothetical protein [Streptosporangiales bacterium]
MTTDVAPAIRAETNVTAERNYRRRRRNDRSLRIALGAGLPILLLLAWQVSSSADILDKRFFPAPSVIVARAIEDAASGTLLGDLGKQVVATLIRIAIGIAVGVTSGILLGTLMGSVRVIRYALAPLVYALYPMPKLAILPLLLIAFGIGNVSKIALVSLGVFFVVGLSAFSGTLYTPQIYEDVSHA